MIKFPSPSPESIFFPFRMQEISWLLSLKQSTQNVLLLDSYCMLSKREGYYHARNGYWELFGMDTGINKVKNSICTPLQEI